MQIACTSPKSVCARVVEHVAVLNQGVEYWCRRKTEVSVMAGREATCSHSGSEGDSPSFVRRRREIFEEERYLHQMKQSLQREKKQLETDRGMLDRERAEKERKEDEHLKIQLVKGIVHAWYYSIVRAL